MAASTNIYSAKDYRVAIAEESAMGTAITSQGSFKELQITEAPQLDCCQEKENRLISIKSEEITIT